MSTQAIGKTGFRVSLKKIKIRRGLAFGFIILTALAAFEIFNFSTTEFALSDLLGDLKFLGLKWATILAVAFCAIDFAGIARLFTPEEGNKQENEVWYLFGAWLLAATMNAMLTWWGVSTAIADNQTLGSAVVGRETLLVFVPIFVAILVWLIRVLIIGSFSVAGGRLFSQGDLERRPTPRSNTRNGSKSSSSRRRNDYHRVPTTVRTTPVKTFQPAPKPSGRPGNPVVAPAPTYHPVGRDIQGAIRE